MVARRKAKMFADAGMWVDVLLEVCGHFLLIASIFLFSKIGSKVIN